MSDFLLLTHSLWAEPPRLRHQVAHLLLDAGHRVRFAERSQPFLALRTPPRAAALPSHLELVQTRRLLHHQLRALPLLHRANAAVLAPQVARLADGMDGTGLTVVNFNYDYFFIRRAFPGQRIVTIINDDFEAMSRLPFRQHITWALRRTCEASDAVLAVSEPLVRRLRKWVDARLFMPWAEHPYRRPGGDMARRTKFVFWGFVDWRLDWAVLKRLSAHLAERGPEWQVWLVGPLAEKDRPAFASSLAACPNIRVMEPRDLDRLPLDEVLAAVIPYVRDEATDAVTVSNKTMRLLSRGLPIVISGMPEFLRAPFIVRLDADRSASEVVDACIRGFMDWQGDIERCIAENSPASRLAALGVGLGNPRSPS
jgi:hypothetical protein